MFDTEKLICEIETRPPLYDVQSKDYSNRELKSKCWIEVAQAMFEDWDSMSAKEKDERVKDLMKKWKSLRDCFMRDHRSATAAGTGKAASSKKRYVYYDQLQFILPYVKGNQNTHSNIAPPTEKKSSSNGDDEGNDDATVVNAVDIDENNQDQTPNDTNNVLGTSTSNNNKSSGKRKFENPNVVAGKRIALEKEFANSAKKLTNILSENLQMQREDKLSDKYGHKAFLLSFVPVLDSMPFHESMRLRSQISQIFTNYYSAQVNISSGPQTPGSTICSESNDDFLISDYINLQ